VLGACFNEGSFTGGERDEGLGAYSERGADDDRNVDALQKHMRRMPDRDAGDLGFRERVLFLVNATRREALKGRQRFYEQNAKRN
jgi:hypothetical protein